MRYFNKLISSIADIAVFLKSQIKLLEKIIKSLYSASSVMFTFSEKSSTHKTYSLLLAYS